MEPKNGSKEDLNPLPALERTPRSSPSPQLISDQSNGKVPLSQLTWDSAADTPATDPHESQDSIILGPSASSQCIAGTNSAPMSQEEAHPYDANQEDDPLDKEPKVKKTSFFSRSSNSYNKVQPTSDDILDKSLLDNDVLELIGHGVNALDVLRERDTQVLMTSGRGGSSDEDEDDAGTAGNGEADPLPGQVNTKMARGGPSGLLEPSGDTPGWQAVGALEHDWDKPVEKPVTRGSGLLDEPPGSKLATRPRKQRRRESILKILFAAEEEEDKDYMPRTSRSNRRKYILDPNRSKFSKNWDIVIIYLMTYTATVTPYEVGFLEPREEIYPLTLINRFVDLLFMTDLVLNFFTAFYDVNIGKWEFNHSLIVDHYLRSWFAMDLLSTLPYDLLNYVAEGAGGLKVLRFLRILKLTKLLRMLRAGRIFERVESSMRIDYSSLELFKFLLFTLMGMHWLACGFNLIVKWEEDGENNWVDNYFSQYFKEHERVSLLDKYVASLYWSAMTISTIGYGDIVPVNMIERLYVTACMLMGALGYGYIIGAVSGIVSTRDFRRNLFHSTMDQLNEFMSYMRISHELQPDLRDYFKYKMSQVDTSAYKSLLVLMSPALRGQVVVQTNSRWISSVYCLRDCPQTLMIDLALQMEYEIFPPSEEIIQIGDRLTQLYVVKSGVVVANRRVKGADSVFAEQCLLSSESISKFTAKTLVFCQIGTISAEFCFRFISLYPKMQMQLKISRIKYTMAEEVKAYADAYKIVMAEKEKPLWPHLQRVVSLKDDMTKANLNEIIAKRQREVKQRENSVSNDARVLHYCRKLRMYIIVRGEVARVKYNNSATKIQRAYRMYRKTGGVNSQKNSLLHYLAVAGGLPSDNFQKTVLLQMQVMKQDQAKLGNAVDRLSRMMERVERKMSMSSKYECAAQS